MKGKSTTRFAGIVCSTTLTLMLLAGNVIAGEVGPIPGAPQPHGKISKPAKQPRASTSTSSSRDLTWFEMVEIALSNLGLL